MIRIRVKFFLAVFLVLSSLSSYHVNAQQLAFPGAVGFGKYAIGGRNGAVYRVTNLNDSGSGSFRDAVSQPNRIVIFDVAGVIRINSRIPVSSNIYIAGQTAPGEGITIYGDGLTFSGSKNVICRYIRVRMGAVGSKDKDAIGVASTANHIIFDHVSVAWGRDENFSITESADNITIQNSIISQGLLAHSCGGLVEPSGYVTIYRSLYIHNDTRNPKLKGRHQFVNNIVYNWKDAAYIMGDSNSRSYADAVGNVFITGPAGSTVAFTRGNDKYTMYASDNIVDKDKNGVFNPVAIPQSDYRGGPVFVNTLHYPELPTIPANQVFEDIVKTVGASLPYRDNLDWLLFDDLSSLGKRGSLISNENELPIGSPDTWVMWKGNTDNRLDSDKDGIPDWWEIAHGLDPNDASDAMSIVDGYANIEHFINSITAEQSQFFLKAPLDLVAEDITQSEIILKWMDFTDFEDGYIVEEKIDGVFQEISRTGKDINTYTHVGLAPETTHTYRVKAFKDEIETAYTNELTIKTRPIPVNVVDPDHFVPDVSWVGGLSGNWNTTENNWEPGNFNTGNSVLFNEASGSVKVNLPQSIDQGTMMIKGDADYQFTGSAIGGSGSINKTGKGKLTLGASNTYTGATVIWNGELEINKLANGGQASSIGASPNYDFNWVWNGGKIRYTGPTVTTNRNVALERTTEFEISNAASTVTIASGSTVAGEGDFIKSGPGKFFGLFGQHAYTGNTIVRDGTYELKGNFEEVGLKGKLVLEGGRFMTSGGADGKDAIHSFPVEVNGEKTSYFQPTRNSQIKSKFSGMGKLQIDVAYFREFYTGNWDEFYGELTVDIRNQELMWSTNLPNARMVLKNGGMKAGSNGLTLSLGALSGDATARLYCSHVKTAGGAVTWKIGGLNTDEDFYGMITSGVTHDSRKGRSNIVKEGNGYWRLTNKDNKYLGYTTVNEGVLIVNGVHTTDKDWDANGQHTHHTPGPYTVNSGGTLAGNGNITTTSVTVKNGGILSPGDGIGTLTINAPVNLEKGSTLHIETDRLRKMTDKLVVTGNKLTIAGDLYIDLIDGEFLEGDNIIFLSASSGYIGTFDNIYPEFPGDNLVWDTSQLFTLGRIKVVPGYTGLHPVQDSKQIIKQEYFDLSGSQVQKHTEGLIFEKTTYNDGSVSIHKMIKLNTEK